MYNKAILIGRLVADPELKTTTQGINVVKFRIAVDRAFSKGEKKADFINITAWQQRAEFVYKYFSKGKPIGVDGSIQTNDYTDKEGNKRVSFEVVADRVFFVESKGSAEREEPPANYGKMEVVESEDDLPFN